MIKRYEWVGPSATIENVVMPENIPLSKREGFYGCVVTPFQLSVQSTGTGALYVDPEMLVSPEERHKVVFVRYNTVTNKWDEFPFTAEGERWRLSITTAGIYALAFNRLKESPFTEDAVSGFPTWFAARSDRNSNMRQFANAAAGILFDVKASLDEVQRRSMLERLPESMPSSTVRYPLEEIGLIEDMVVQVQDSVDYRQLERAEGLKDFLYDTSEGVWLLDEKRSVVHLMESFDKIVVTGIVKGEPFSKTVKGERKDYFNDFDEIGLQFGLPRIKGESNKDYRIRLLSLFSHPGNATELGVKREIARRAGAFRSVIWEDDRVGMLVMNASGSNYALDDVHVDGQPIEVHKQSDGGFLIKPTNLGKRRVVLYYTAPETYLLGKHRRTENGEMSGVDAASYAIWDEVAPVLYGGVKYDRQEWDMVNDEALVEWMPVTDSDMGRWD